METKTILRTHREKRGLTQEQLADRLYVTRQAVSRWENGETVPGVETLKLISQVFDVSVNTLLGLPRKLTCQCCGMELSDDSIGREEDRSFNEEYCKWCYVDGRVVYQSLEELTDFLVGHLSHENWPPEAARAFFDNQLPTLNHWRKE